MNFYKSGARRRNELVLTGGFGCMILAYTNGLENHEGSVANIAQDFFEKAEGN